MEGLAKFLFGISGNVIALFLFLSPVPTFWRIIRRKSTEDFSGVPYNMTLLNCLLAAWYGLPLVSPNNILVSTINGAGAVIETAYVLTFLWFAASKKARLRTLGLASAVAAVFAFVALVSLLALRGQGRKLFCGLATTIFSICMYASPLSIMRLVVKTKSVEYMPFLLSLAVFLCGTSWFIYGLLGGDPFIIVSTQLSSKSLYYEDAGSPVHYSFESITIDARIPNGCGSFLGAVQLVLYAIYRKNNKAGKQGEDVEMSSKARNSKVAHHGAGAGAGSSTPTGKMDNQV